MRRKKFVRLIVHFVEAKTKNFSEPIVQDEFLKYIFVEYLKRLKELKGPNRFNLKKDIKVKMIAHNAKAYDVQFIIKYCLKNNYTPKNIMKKGNKILSMEILNYHFIDSLCFLPLPLKSLPKTFGIPDLCKGEFPHSYNKPENWDKILNHLPDIKFYCPNDKTEKDKNLFLQWYDENKNSEFNFREEIKKYCVTDVEILMKAVMIFRDNWKELSKLIVLREI